MISIETEEISNIGEKIVEINEEIKLKVNQFLSITEKINTAWEGADATKYINTLKEKYVVGLNELVDVINEYGVYLGNVVEAYNLLDEIFASKSLDF